MHLLGMKIFLWLCIHILYVYIYSFYRGTILFKLHTHTLKWTLFQDDNYVWPLFISFCSARGRLGWVSVSWEDPALPNNIPFPLTKLVLVILVGKSSKDDQRVQGLQTPRSGRNTPSLLELLITANPKWPWFKGWRNRSQLFW